MTKRVTIKDIACAAGVSAATVSYVLNNTPGKSISQETKLRIQQATEQLQYIPNFSAQRLKSNRSKCIAVRLSRDLTVSRYHSILQGIRTQLAANGYSILLSSYDDRGSLAGCMDACMSGQADGLIYVASHGVGILPKEMEKLRQWNIPVSTIDCMGSVPDVSSIVYDYYSSARIRMDVLLEKGYRKFIYLRPAYQNYKEIAREQGVRSALEGIAQAQLTVKSIPSINEQWLHRQTYGPETKITKQAGKEIKEILAGIEDDVAVVCYVREMQDIAAQVLLLDELRNPDRKTDWTQRCVSFHFPHYESGVEAARSLLSMLDEGAAPRKLSSYPILDFYDREML